MAEIVVAGHICLDIIPRFLGPAEIRPGKLIEVGEAELATGGCVSNVGRALYRLGVDVRLRGKIGDDPFGGIVRALLEEEAPELAQDLRIAEGGKTSYSVVLNIPGRDRTFLHMPGENDTFSSADLGADEFPGARLLHFGYPPLMATMFEDGGAELETLLRAAKTRGMTTSLDMSLPDPTSASGHADWDGVLACVLPWVDLFFPSEEELAFMLRTTVSADELAQRCVERGAGVVVVKRGDRGLVAHTSDALDRDGWAGRIAKHPCFEVEVSGTTGAGDATIAGFLMGFVRGFNLEECLAAGCAVGAHCVEGVDAVSAIRSWEETRARMAAGWRKREA